MMPMIANAASHGEARGVGEQRKTEPDHAVGAHFEEHSCEHDRACGGGFDVSVGEPGVQGKKRDLDRERAEECQEQEHFLLRGQRGEPAVLQELLNLWQVEGAAQVVEPDDADEHEDRASHRIQDKFDGGVDAALMSPDTDQEGHGDQHDLPEQEEEEEVEGKEDADNADLEQQQHDEEFFYAVIDTLPGSKNRYGRQERGQDDEEETDAVHAQVVVDRRVGNPVVVFDQTVARYAYGHSRNEQKRKDEFDQGNCERQAANPDVILAAQEQQGEGAQRGEEDQNREQAGKHQRTIPIAAGFEGQKKIIAMTTMAPMMTQTA